ncbi:hypothetical protein Bca4012_038733 [Brassica carinata]
MCKDFGQQDVDQYRIMRREEYGVAEDGTDVVPPRQISWRGLRAKGYLQISEEKLMSI